jgi:hypothetical protein
MIMYQVNDPATNEPMFWTPEHYSDWHKWLEKWRKALENAETLEVTAAPLRDDHPIFTLERKTV